MAEASWSSADPTRAIVSPSLMNQPANAEIMPTVAPRQLEPVVIKKRYSGFFNTDLDTVLRGLDVETLFVAGVNTNNCVLGTVFDAHARDYLVVVLEDACGSMNGPDYHAAALDQIRAALGFTMLTEAFTAMLSARDAATHGRAARQSAIA